MNIPALIHQTPESYATFWAPLGSSLPPTPSRAEPALVEWQRMAKDAYLEFTEISEGLATHARGERS